MIRFLPYTVTRYTAKNRRQQKVKFSEKQRKKEKTSL